MKIKNSYVEQPPEEQFDKKVQGTFIGDKHTK